MEAIPGDVSLSDLGMSTKDREKITSEAEIIFHCAATVRFDEPLKKAVLLNVRGTKLMLELAKECNKLLVSIFNKIKNNVCNEGLIHMRPVSGLKSVFSSDICSCFDSLLSSEWEGIIWNNLPSPSRSALCTQNSWLDEWRSIGIYNAKVRIIVIVWILLLYFAL